LVAAAPAQPAPKTDPVNPVTEAAQPQPLAGTQQATAAPKAAAPGTPQTGWDAFGRGDYKGALEVWQPLAEKGDVAMQLLVGSIYDFGQGVPQDDAEAVKWYQRAAEQGSAKGQFQVGAVYARSPQIKDPVQAYKWLTIAARTLSKGPQSGVTEDQATTLRSLIQTQMSKDEIAKAKAEADAFKSPKG
jgi:TPR repeat protein